MDNPNNMIPGKRPTDQLIRNLMKHIMQEEGSGPIHDRALITLRRVDTVCAIGAICHATIVNPDASDELVHEIACYLGMVYVGLQQFAAAHGIHLEVPDDE